MRDPFSDKWHLPFVRKFRRKFSVTWYSYFFGTENRNGLELCLNWRLALVIPTTVTENFGRFGDKGKKVIPRKVWYYFFFPEKVHHDEPFHLNSPRNFLVFHTNGKRSRFHKHNRRPHVMNMHLRHYWLHNGFASFGWKACLSSRAPKYRFVWDYFPLKKYCCKEPQKCISVFFYICCVIYTIPSFTVLRGYSPNILSWETALLPLP